MGKKSQPQQQQQTPTQQSQSEYQSLTQPSGLETGMGKIGNNMMNYYNQAVAGNTEDYGRTMGGYQNFMAGAGKRPGELNEAYGSLRGAGKGYEEFAQTGGYSGKDIQELRARGMAPIRASYGNTIRELDRSRALGAQGGSANYIAARSRAQRELPGQMADAMTGVNAELANAIRQGRLAGMGGMAQVGQTMGGLAGEEQSRYNQAMLGGLAGQTGLYGTTPGLSNMFGNQALSAYGQAGQLYGNRMQGRSSALGNQIQAQQVQQQKTPWWQTALGMAGNVAGPMTEYFTERNRNRNTGITGGLGGRQVKPGDWNSEE